MLIVTRREGEAIVIGDGVRVTVVAAHGGQVRIGVQASRDVEVHREEVWQRINLDRVVLIAPIRVRLAGVLRGLTARGRIRKSA